MTAVKRRRTRRRGEDGGEWSGALADTAGTRLGRAVAADVAANPGKTGVHTLPAPRDAFAARVLLAAELQAMRSTARTLRPSR